MELTMLKRSEHRGKHVLSQEVRSDIGYWVNHSFFLRLQAVQTLSHGCSPSTWPSPCVKLWTRCPSPPLSCGSPCLSSPPWCRAYPAWPRADLEAKQSTVESSWTRAAGPAGVFMSTTCEFRGELRPHGAVVRFLGLFCKQQWKKYEKSFLLGKYGRWKTNKGKYCTEIIPHSTNTMNNVFISYY